MLQWITLLAVMITNEFGLRKKTAKLGFFVLVFVTHVFAVGPQARVLIHICNQAGVGENCSFLTCLGCPTHKQNQSSQHLMCPGQRKMVLMAITVKNLSLLQECKHLYIKIYVFKSSNLLGPKKWMVVCALFFFSLDYYMTQNWTAMRFNFMLLHCCRNTELRLGPRQERGKTALTTAFFGLACSWCISMSCSGLALWTRLSTLNQPLNGSEGVQKAKVSKSVIENDTMNFHWQPQGGTLFLHINFTVKGKHYLQNSCSLF